MPKELKVPGGRLVFVNQADAGLLYNFIPTPPMPELRPGIRVELSTGKDRHVFCQVDPDSYFYYYNKEMDMVMMTTIEKVIAVYDRLGREIWRR